MRKLLACLLIFTLTGPRLWARTDPDQTQIAKVRAKVAQCLERHRRVTIATYNGRLLQGSVSEASADAFVLTNNGRSTTLNYADVRKIKWPSAVSKQVKVAIETAAIVGALFGFVVLLGGLRG